MIHKGDKHFGARIKELREKKQYTQEQLAEIIEMDSRSLSRIETGMSFTTVDKLKRLASALDVEIKDLFTTNHKQDKKRLISEINNLLDTASSEKVQLVYRVVLSILR